MKNNKIAYDADYEIAKRWMLENVGFYFDIQKITPEKAKEILEDKGANRNVSGQRVAKYSEIMKQGQWEITPQGISFDENGQLSDGQHRLEAIIKSKTSQTFLIFYEVPKKDPFDLGLSRREADSLAIRGLLDPDLATTSIMSMMNALLYVRVPKNYGQITIIDKSFFIKKYADEFQFSYKTSTVGKTHGVGGKAPIRTAILAAAICNVDFNILEDFARILNTGYCTGENQTSALALRNFLTEKNYARGRQNNVLVEMMAEEAIRDFVNKKPRHRRYPGKEHPFSLNIDVIGIIKSEKEMGSKPAEER